MAKAYGVASQISGKVGQVVFAQTKNGTVVYESPKKPVVPQRTANQQLHRMQWANMAAVYVQFHQTLKHGFEGLPRTMTDYNAFVQANMGVCRVYITKQMRLNGGSVLAPYQITRGSLPGIATVKNEANQLVTDIELGRVSIDGTTTVAAFSAAVVDFNANYEEGDQITFFYGEQTVDPVTEVPRASITGFKVVLDSTDPSLLYDMVSPLGFTNVDGHLGMSQVITDGAAAWIHSREAANGTLLVSPQKLYVDSSVLESYQTAGAFEASSNSYGGINSVGAFLKPSR